MKGRQYLTSVRMILLGVLLAGAIPAGFTFIVPATAQLIRNRHAPAQLGTGYDLSWYTLDGGAVMFAESSDREYELSGTIGQPDAGGPMTDSAGSGYELTGGFWFALAPGDCNSDAGVNLFDHRDFADCLSGPGGAPLSPQCACFDLNRNGTVDLADFALLTTGFTGG